MAKWEQRDNQAYQEPEADLDKLANQVSLDWLVQQVQLGVLELENLVDKVQQDPREVQEHLVPWD